MTKQFDAIVYGATPAGLTAAVALARQGLRPAVLEPGRFIGGMVTGGLCRTDFGSERTVGGLARDYFDRCSAKYGGRHKWYLEPHIFSLVFRDMLRECGIEPVLEEKLAETETAGGSIAAVRMKSGRRYTAPVFIDCTYEGDLLAQAGVPYKVGRESADQYGEPLAGVQPDNPTNLPGVEPLSEALLGRDCACLEGPPGLHYVRSGPFAPAFGEDGRPNKGVRPYGAGERGSGDGLTQAYTFRLVVTRDKGNRVPFPRPERYDPSAYELLLRYIERWPTIRLSRLVHFGRLAGDKFDVNSNGPFSTDFVGGNADYPDGDDETRERIRQAHVDYVQGFFWFLGHDSRVPAALREEVGEWGLAKDEFADNGHWPYQLYVREARRMRGDYVMTQADLTDNRAKPDAIALGSFQIDSHPVQRLVGEGGLAVNEGHIDMRVQPYAIPYRSLVPRADDCANLLVPVCLSASHIAYGSLRMEPVYMMLGHAAGLAAGQAITHGLAVQQIDIAELQRKLREQRQRLDLNEGAE